MHITENKMAEMYFLLSTQPRSRKENLWPIGTEGPGSNLNTQLKFRRLNTRDACCLLVEVLSLCTRNLND